MFGSRQKWSVSSTIILSIFYRLVSHSLYLQNAANILHMTLYLLQSFIIHHSFHKKFLRKAAMETLVSSWYNIQPLPESYIFPPEKRPGEVVVPLCNTIPVIDLGKTASGHCQSEIIHQILQASEEFGFFQVINHGIAEDLMDETMKIFKEFFEMPAEDKASIYSEDQSKSCRLYTGSIYYAKEEYHFWRDNLKHPCHPLEDCIQFWPEKPNRYREIVGRYSVEVRKLSLKILELICAGLGLEPGFFKDELTKVQLLSVNHYPPCPDPSLTLGLPKHCDPNVVTLLQQGDVYGLQVVKDGQWIGVEPRPNAFVVNIGHQLQIISNDKLRSVEHRAVTNSREARTVIVNFINPSSECVVEPAKSLVNECSPSLYKAFQYKEFASRFRDKIADTSTVLEPFKL